MVDDVMDKAIEVSKNILFSSPPYIIRTGKPVVKNVKTTSVKKIKSPDVSAGKTPLTPYRKKTRRTHAFGRGVSYIPPYTKPIPNWEDRYAITNDGRIWSHRSSKWISISLSEKGRPKAELWRGSVRTNYKVHRLVALTYLPNPELKPEINHIDGDKTNNHFSNLEWCTRSENVEHAIANGLMFYQKAKE